MKPSTLPPELSKTGQITPQELVIRHDKGRRSRHYHDRAGRAYRPQPLVSDLVSGLVEGGRESENQQWKLRIQEEGRRRTVEKRIF